MGDLVDHNLQILLKDLQPFADKPVGSIRIDMNDVRSILVLAAEIEKLRRERDHHSDLREQYLAEATRLRGELERKDEALRGINRETMRCRGEQSYRDAVKFASKVSRAALQPGDASQEAAGLREALAKERHDALMEAASLAIPALSFARPLEAIEEYRRQIGAYTLRALSDPSPTGDGNG